MAFRDDLTAAQSRADALERENAALRDRIAQLEAPPEADPAESVADDGRRAVRAAVVLVAIVVLGSAGTLAAGRFGVAPMIAVGLLTIAIVVSLLVTLLLYLPVDPDQLVVVSGLRYGDRGFDLLTRGRLRRPIVETVDRMDARPFAIELALRNLYSKDGPTVALTGRARVRIDRQPPAAYNAVERFLGRSTAEIGRVARETIEGRARGVVAGLTVPEIVENAPAQLSAAIAEDCIDDFEKLGLVLDSLELSVAADD